MIRITGGKLKGRVLKVADSENLRPTTSFFREWIFNVLSFQINFEEIDLLDLFCGSGIISFEFLSRGAGRATLVENNSKVIKQLEENLTKLKVERDCIRIERNDVSCYLKNITSGPGCRHNLIFLDPPYKIDIIQQLLDQIGSNGEKFPEDLIIIIESPAAYKINIPDSLQLFKEKKGGASKMSVLTRKG